MAFISAKLVGRSLLALGVGVRYIGPYVEAYLKGFGSPKATPLSDRNTGLRKAATDFLESHSQTGRLWDAVQIFGLREIAHLTDPRRVLVIDGPEAEKIVAAKSAEHIAAGISPPVDLIGDQIGKLLQTDLHDFVILIWRGDATKATGSVNGGTILHELIHVAEYQAGRFDAPGHGDDPALRECNTAWFDAALLAIDEIDGLVGPKRILGAPGDDRFGPEDLEDILVLVGMLVRMVDLENGEATRELFGRRHKPDLAFVRQATGCDMSLHRVLAHLAAGHLGPRAQRATALAAPLAGIARDYWKDRDTIKAFARIHYDDAAERAAYIAEVLPRAEAKRERDRAFHLEMLRETLAKGTDAP